ncbi:hypothetical protein [Mameliella sediminis]|uniref:hypothetical protein n=1 Tax=Mameliella sediminis TaxID=2836866 RepID=UPI001C45419B|nr:hypothetical protein [Mameliella sediminis]MBV7395900.1 hypothetical protein [Mameliella sediminis]
MHRRDAHVLTHYTNITEAKGNEVRNLRAMAAQAMLGKMRHALRRAVLGMTTTKRNASQHRA